MGGLKKKLLASNAKILNIIVTTCSKFGPLGRNACLDSVDGGGGDVLYEREGK